MRAALLLLALLGLLSGHPDFSGTWVLDPAASDSMEPMMAAEGLNLVERKAYCSLALTQKLTQSATRLRIETRTAVLNNVETLLLDRQPQTSQVYKVGKVSFRSYWAGATLVTDSSLKAADGRPATASLRRQLSPNGKLQIQLLTLQLSDGHSFRVRRVFRRT